MRSHKEHLFLFYPTVQIIFVFSKSTDAHPRQDVLPDKFRQEYIYRNKNGWFICYDSKCIWVLVPFGSSISLFNFFSEIWYPWCHNRAALPVPLRSVSNIKDGKHMVEYCLLWSFIEWKILQIDSCKMKGEIQFFIRLSHTEKK